MAIDAWCIKFGFIKGKHPANNKCCQRQKLYSKEIGCKFLPNSAKKYEVKIFAFEDANNYFMEAAIFMTL